jgi:hypothetical protein
MPPLIFCLFFFFGTGLQTELDKFKKLLCKPEQTMWSMSLEKVEMMFGWYQMLCARTICSITSKWKFKPGFLCQGVSTKIEGIVGGKRNLRVCR